MHKLISLTTALFLLAGPGVAQDPVAMSLEEAIAIALENNPDYRAQVNDENVADWGVRSAYANLLPSATASGGVSYQEGGQARIGGFTAGDIGLGQAPDYYYSSYNLSVGLGLSGADFYQIGREKASRRSVLATVEVAGQTLEANVTRQYMAVLRTSDAVDLARTELERAEANLSLTEARYAVEAATALEAKQAAVERGRAQINLLRAESTLENEKVRLLELIGLDLDEDVVLTSDVPVFEPRWSLSSLVDAAMSSQPRLEAARATSDAAESGVKIARSSYWPSLSISTGLAGYTRRVGSDQYLIDQRLQAVASAREQCMLTNQILTRLTPPMEAQDCGAIQFTDEDRANILEQNDQFPFQFVGEPLSLSVGLSVPIFQGLNRKQQLETARSQAEDARWRLRAQELATRSAVETAYRDLETAYQAVRLEETNLELARDQLRLARERYRVGTAAFLELMEAEALMARADREYLLGVYTFQEALTMLEQAVGQELATPEN